MLYNIHPTLLDYYYCEVFFSNTTFIKYQKSDRLSDKLISALSELNEQFMLVGSYESTSDALALLSNHKPTFIVVNSIWYSAHCFAMIPKLRGIYSNVELLVDTVNSFPELVECYFNATNNDTLYVLSEEQAIEILVFLLKKKIYLVNKIFNNGIENQHAAPCIVSMGKCITTAEKKVLSHLVKGLSYKLIAAELGLSIETIKVHMRNIYRKLDVNNSSSAIAIAIRHSLI